MLDEPWAVQTLWNGLINDSQSSKSTTGRLQLALPHLCSVSERAQAAVLEQGGFQEMSQANPEAQSTPGAGADVGRCALWSYGPSASRGSAPCQRTEGLGKGRELSWRHLPCCEIMRSWGLRPGTDLSPPGGVGSLQRSSHKSGRMDGATGTPAGVSAQGAAGQCIHTDSALLPPGCVPWPGWAVGRGRLGSCCPEEVPQHGCRAKEGLLSFLSLPCHAQTLP